MPSNAGSHVISSADLERFARALFVAAGVAPAMADAWAKSLVWANLRGVDSHGVLRIPGYIERLKSKAINPAPDMRVEKRAGALAVLEADRAPGAVAMTVAMAEAIARAREAHIGWCAARNITHAGAVGYFALQAANAGMAGIDMSASGPMMAYHGAKVAGVSSNPLAIAFPAKDRQPLLLDMSTSTVAMGKVMSARDAGRDIPLGWGLDAEGRDTTDPGKLATLLPLGGPKGSGLSFMIECLAASRSAIRSSRPRLRPAASSTRRFSTGSRSPSILARSAIARASSRKRIAWRAISRRLRPPGASSASIFRASAATACCANACTTAFPCRTGRGRGSSPAPKRSRCRRRR
jgi:ureidoglycolate dehydrogenase (NAD+)